LNVLVCGAVVHDFRAVLVAQLDGIYGVTRICFASITSWIPIADDVSVTATIAVIRVVPVARNITVTLETWATVELIRAGGLLDPEDARTGESQPCTQQEFYP
jgi:hypothetical protein